MNDAQAKLLLARYRNVLIPWIIEKLQSLKLNGFQQVLVEEIVEMQRLIDSDKRKESK